MQPTYEELFLQNQALMQQVQILTQQLKEAFAEIKTLKAKVKELEEKLNTNSSNSSKAPSQDPFRLRKPKKPTGRRQGVQKGQRVLQQKEMAISRQMKQSFLSFDLLNLKSSKNKLWMVCHH